MPLKAREARVLIRRLLEEGTFFFSKHAKKEMGNDRLTDVDIKNVLKTGIVEEPEMEHGSWRYRVRRQQVEVIVTIDPEPECLPDSSESLAGTEVVVVTAWRNKP